MKQLIGVFAVPVLVMAFLLWLNAEMGYPIR